MAHTQQKVQSLGALNQTTNALNVSEYRTLTFDVSGTFVGTVQVQVSINGTTWRNLTGSATVLNLATGAYLSSGNITAAGVYGVDISSHQFVRLIMTAYTSGSATVEYVTVTTGNIPAGASTVTASGTVTANQGTLAAGTTYNLVTAATTNLTAAVTTARNLFELTVSNPTATPAFLKLYNKASAPVVASDIPVATIPVPANSFQSLDFGSQGKRFATGIALAVTANIGVTDATATVAGIQINGTYI